MSSNTLNEFLFDILLMGIGCWCIINEEKLIKIERQILRRIKKVVKK